MEGVRFGDFEVKKKLGEGGMGQVYLARQISLDRNVALKVLPERLARDESFRVRFEREARQAARLNHPNIIQMYAYGIKDGIPYFAMEFVEGTDLAALLRSRGRFPVREALRVTKDVAKALAAAEKRKVVHRDIKPSNIMVKEDGTVKVMDFGLAKAIGSQSMVTQANMVLGTPHYMSPEQGKGAQVDVRSDLYSLGVVLFELLTGEVPFKADTPTSLIYQHIYEQPPPLRGKNPEIPPAVESLVIKMLAKDPDQRFQSPVDVVKVIEQVESGAAPSAGGPMTLEIDLPPSEAATLKQERPAVDQRQTDARRVTPVGETTPATPASGQQLTVVVKSRPWVPIVITLIILGAVGGGVYFAYRRGLFRRVSEPPRPTPNGQQKPNGRKPDGQQKPDGQKPPPKPPPPVGHAKVRFPASKLLGRLPSGTVATIRATGTPPVHGIRLDSDIEVEEGRYTVRMERKGYEPVEVSLIVDETGVSPPLTTVRPEWRLRKDLQEALDAAENYRIEKKFELAVRELEKVVKVIPDYDGGKVRQNLERMRTLQEKQVAHIQAVLAPSTDPSSPSWERLMSCRGSRSISAALGQAPEQVPHWKHSPTFWPLISFSLAMKSVFLGFSVSICPPRAFSRSQHRLLVPGAVALDVHRHRHTGDVCREGLHMHCERRHRPAEALRPGAQGVDAPQQLRLELGHLGVGMGTSHLAQQRAFGQQRRLLDGPPDPHPHDGGRAGLPPTGHHVLHHSFLDPFKADPRGEHL